MLSICINVKNRSLVREDGHELRLFPNCVESIVRSARADLDMEVIVADWHSDDWPLVEWFEDAIGVIPHRVVELEGAFNRGQGRNRAAAAALGDVLFFLDADCTLDASVCAAATRSVEQGRAFFPILYSFSDATHMTGWWRDSGYGNCAVSPEVFKSVGGWPEYERWGKEDDDFFAKVSSVVKVDRDKTPGLYHQWHPNTVLFKERHTAHYPWMLDEFTRRDALLAVLQDMCQPDETFILVDEARFGNDPLPGYTVLPFLEQHGHYGGPPPDDSTAIRELERMRQAGAQFIAFAWMSNWWLDYYAGFAHHLESHYTRKFSGPDVIIYDLSEQITQPK